MEHITARAPERPFRGALSSCGAMLRLSRSRVPLDLHSDTTELGCCVCRTGQPDAVSGDGDAHGADDSAVLLPAPRHLPQVDGPVSHTPPAPLLVINHSLRHRSSGLAKTFGLELEYGLGFRGGGPSQ